MRYGRFRQVVLYGKRANYNPNNDQAALCMPDHKPSWQVTNESHFIHNVSVERVERGDCLLEPYARLAVGIDRVAEIQIQSNLRNKQIFDNQKDCKFRLWSVGHFKYVLWIVLHPKGSYKILSVCINFRYNMRSRQKSSKTYTCGVSSNKKSFV